MAVLSARLRSVSFGAERSGLAFWCPGCGGSHAIVTKDASDRHPLWTWDGNVDAPTISPSILVRIEWTKNLQPGFDQIEWKDTICHSFVRGGNIEFLGDCTHALRRQKVPLPDWPGADQSYLDVLAHQAG